MTDECRNDCIDKLLFPKQPFNRPGLSRIDYRIGTYSDILEALHRKLNQSDVLADWTHREADDPGIALLEGASILGDILTFYQEVYANEAYLRTAQWRDSISDLARLLGYRLSPGVGGKATFAFEVKGDKPVVIPTGFPVKAQLEEQAKPVDFETVKESTAFPSLSEFNLYRPRLSPQKIKKGSNRLEVGSVGDAYDVESIRGVNLKPGDRLILMPSGEILIVKGVEQVLDRTIIEIEGSLTSDPSTSVTAYRIGRSFRHFGHNAPVQYTRLEGEGLLGALMKADDTDFDRRFDDKHDKYQTVLETDEIPIASEVDDLAIGNIIICQGVFVYNYKPPEPHMPENPEAQPEFTIEKNTKKARSVSLNWGNLAGESTVLTLDCPLWSEDLTIEKPPLDDQGKDAHNISSSDDQEEDANNILKNVVGDIRRMRFHEVKSPKLQLRALTEWEEKPLELQLNFWGTCDEARNLVGRSLLLKKEEMEALQVTVTTTRESLDKLKSNHHDEIHPWLWPIYVDKNLDAFSPEDFDEENPNVTVYGNLVEATQGKSEKEAVLGNGDNRETFQTFKLPKAPLTYFTSKDETPPEVPELEVFVNERLWTRVPSFYGHGPKEQIYIVREDDDNNSWLQFGDGKTGARLPSGLKNVVARYRTGTGAYGPLKEGATPQPGSKLDRLRKVYLPGIATGGSGPEDGDNAREAAPGKIQSLGRLVSLKDFETEAVGISGVEKASANWRLENNIPTVVITALMESGREKEGKDLQDTMNAYNKDRGADRFPVAVHLARRQYIYLTLVVGFDPSYQQEQVEKTIKEVLGVTGEEDKGIDGSQGLFGIKHRLLGQKEYASRIEGTVQNVKGVIWSKVKYLGFVEGDSDDPLELTRPEQLENHAVIPGLLLMADRLIVQKQPPSWSMINLGELTQKPQPETEDILFCLHVTHLDVEPGIVNATEVIADD